MQAISELHPDFIRHGIVGVFYLVGNMIIVIDGYNVLIDKEDFEKIKNYDWHISTHDIPNKLYYFRCQKGEQTVRLHREIMGCTYKDGREVDHINGDTLDNRKQNLRVCSHSQNGKNMKINKRNNTGYKGISWHPRDKCYQARIGVNNKRIYLGYFDNPEDAHAAYCAASKKYHGEFGRVK